MSLRDRLRTLAAGDQNPFGNTQTPPYGLAPAQSANPIDQMVGRTPPAVDPGHVRPRVGPPIGASGRANFYGLPQPDETNAQLVGAQGLRNFDLMYRTDPDIRRLVLMCWSPIVAGTWTLEPFGGDESTDQDQKIADAIWWALTKHMSPNFFEHLNELGPVLLRSGFTPFEQVWAPIEHDGETLMMPRRLDLRLPRSVWRWFQDEYGELTHISQILPNKGDVTISASDLTYYRVGSEGDNWVGTSLLRYAYKPWVLKDRLERIDAIGQERKAVGVPIVYMPENADDQTRDDIETILAHLHTNEVGYVLMPGPHAQDVKDMPGTQGYRVEVIKFDSSSGDSIQASLKYHRDGIASAFLGDFMQLGHHQVGARATAQVQEDPFLTAVEALGTYIIPPLDRLAARITELNWPSASGAPTFTLTIHDQASLSEIATYVQQLVTVGAMQADPELEDWLRDRADLPPANSDMRQARQDAQQAQTENAAAAAQNGAAPQGQNGTADPATLAQAEPTVKWWENLLSQDRLREALDGARQHVEDTARAPAMLAAQKLAHQAVNQSTLSSEPPEALVNALDKHLSDMHALGHDTARVELARQRQLMQLAIPDTLPGSAPAARALRAARTIIERVVQKLEQWLLNHGHAGPNGAQAQQVAERAALAALHEVALDYTAAQINDGRLQAAHELDAAGAIRTAVLDSNTCKQCAGSDTGRVLALPEVIAHPLPDPDCSGGDRCRCTYVFVMSDDPAAIAAGLG